MNRMSKAVTALCLTLLLSLLAASLPQPGLAAGPGVLGRHCRWVYEYEAGIPLSVIARWFGVSLQSLQAANPWLKGHRPAEGDLLCIPQPGFSILYPKAVLQAQVRLGRVTVWGEHFPVRASYFVRIRAYRDGSWKRLGLLRPSEDGEIYRHYKLPKSLLEEKRFEVCLKETRRNYVVCTIVDNRWLGNQ
ncbi:MAG: hypothetical protein ACKOC5_14615 [Chloroflexota bacterium]